jgi:hypothetical protein
MEEWKALLDRLRQALHKQLGNAEEANKMAGPLADAWLNAAELAGAIQRLSRGDDLSQSLRDILTALDEFEVEALWYFDPPARLWRQQAGFPWHVRNDESELLANAIGCWFKDASEATLAARLLVDLRRVAKRATVELSHREILAAAKGPAPGGKRKVTRLLDRMWSISRAARVSLRRHGRPNVLDMADEARNDYLAGRTEPLDPDNF